MLWDLEGIMIRTSGWEGVMYSCMQSPKGAGRLLCLYFTIFPLRFAASQPGRYDFLYRRDI